ncbi:MAG: ABC transporter permease [Anaerolineae bacterium]|nr:ABC transporter permease [Anaerolineae bacterium]
MSKVFSIMLNDLRVFFREPGQIIGLVVIPLILTIGVGIGNGGFGGGPPQIRIDVIDQDNSAVSQQFVEDLRAVNSGLQLCPMDSVDNSCRLGNDLVMTLERSDQRVLDDTVEAVIVIPAGFGEKVQNGQAVDVLYRAEQSGTGPSAIEQSVQAVVSRIGSAQVAAVVGMDVAGQFPPLQFRDEADRAAFQDSVYDRATALLDQDLGTVTYALSESNVADTQQVIGTQAGFGQSVPGMGSMFVMFTVFGALFILIRERKNWTLQRLVMMPLTRSQILGGKILMWFVAGMIQFVVVFVIGLALRVNFGDQPLAMLVVMVLFTLCMTALAFAVSTFLKTEQQANSISLLLALTLAPLGGAWWPLDIVPEFMRTIGHLTPVAWTMDAFQTLIFEQGTLLTILPNLAILTGFTAVFFIIAVRRFRYE